MIGSSASEIISELLKAKQLYIMLIEDQHRNKTLESWLLLYIGYTEDKLVQTPYK